MEKTDQPPSLDAGQLTDLVQDPGAALAEVTRAISWVKDEDAGKLVSELLGEAKEALEQVKSELVLLLRSHDNLAVVTFNPAGLITSVCRNSPELLGQPVENLIGRPIDSILVERAQGADQSSREMQKADAGKVVHTVRNHLREDGSNFKAEHTLVAVVGREEHVVGFVREIRETTDEKVHEVHIKELDRVIAFLLKEQEG